MNRDDHVDIEPPTDMAPKDRVRVNFWLRRDLYEQVLEVAAEDDIKVAPAIRQAIKYYVRARKEGRA